MSRNVAATAVTVEAEAASEAATAEAEAATAVEDMTVEVAVDTVPEISPRNSLSISYLLISVFLGNLISIFAGRYSNG